MTPVLLDTSVFIAAETGRSVSYEVLGPDTEVAISVVTLAELTAGVLAATDTDTRSRRLGTLDGLSDVLVLPIDEAVAREWARLRVHLAETGRRLNVNDLWIAATAIATGRPVATQDGDFEVLEDVAGLTVLRV